MTDIVEPKRMAWRSELVATLTLAWPMVLTNISQVLMNVTDVMFLGRLGPEALAAAALATNLYFMLIMPGIGLMQATAPMMAREFGARPHSVREIRRIVRHGLWLALGYFLLLFPLLWNGGAILAAMGQDPELARDAGTFLRLLMWAIPSHLVFLVLRSFVSARERPRVALVVTILAVVFNAFANWVLIFGKLGIPALGLSGSGLATALSSLMTALALGGYILADRHFRRFQLFGRLWRLDMRHFLALVKLGLPIAALLGLEVGAFAMSALSMGLIDADSLAAHAIAIQITSVGFMVPLGIGQAATVRVGLSFGARSRDGIDRAGWCAFALGIGFMMLTALTMFAVPRLLISAYLDPSAAANQPVITLAATFMFWAALFQISDGAQAVLSGMLRGIHDTAWPMVYGVIGYWIIGLPTGLLLAFRTPFRGEGIWIGLTTGLTVVAALLLWRWLGARRRGYPDGTTAAADT